MLYAATCNEETAGSTARRHERARTAAGACAGRLSASLHVPSEVNGRAHRMRLCQVKVGLELVMGLHARWHTETGGVSLEQRLSLAQGDPNHQRGLVLYAHHQAIVDVPSRMRFGPLAFHLGQRLGVPGNLFEGHRSRVGPAHAHRLTRARTVAMRVRFEVGGADRWGVRNMFAAQRTA